MHTIEFESKLDKPQAAFVIFYSMEAQPWAYYPADDSGRHELVFPVCLMINRADGAIGFIGGKVDGTETLVQAAIREVQEEIGHKVAIDLEPLIAHDIGAITTHAFTAEVSYNEMRGIQKNSVLGEHFGSEVTGVFLPHLIDYRKAIGKEGGILNLLQASMAPSVREELIHFLIKRNVITREELVYLCGEAGYKLSTLLQ